jgi:hypothetical protein
MATVDEGYVSADGHVVEPADLWTTRIDREFRARAPRVEARASGDYYINRRFRSDAGGPRRRLPGG